MEAVAHGVLKTFASRCGPDCDNSAMVDLASDLAAAKQTFVEAAELWPAEPTYASAAAALSHEITNKGHAFKIDTLISKLEGAVASAGDEASFEQQCAAVADAASDCEGLETPSNLEGPMLQHCAGLVAKLAGCFPKHFSATSSMFAALAKVVTGLRTSNNVQAEIAVLLAAGHLYTAMSAFDDLGSDLLARVQADPEHDCTTDMMRKALALGETLKKLGDQPATETEIYPTLLQKATALEESIANAVIQHLVQELASETESAKPWANGATEGASWHAALGEGAAWSDVAGEAKKSLLKDRMPDQYIGKKQKLDSTRSRLESACGFFSRKADQCLVTEAVGVSKALAVSYIEGLFCALFSAKLSKDAYKSKAHGIKKLCKPNGVPWEDILRPIRDRANTAVKLIL